MNRIEAVSTSVNIGAARTISFVMPVIWVSLAGMARCWIHQGNATRQTNLMVADHAPRRFRLSDRRNAQTTVRLDVDHDVVLLRV